LDKKTNEIKCGGNSWKKKTNSENDKKKTMTQYRKKIKIKNKKKYKANNDQTKEKWSKIERQNK
jgi:hypothetical protein